MSIVFIWRGFGLIVPIVFGICAWIVSYWYDDTRLGNASFMGWSMFYTAIVLVLPGLMFWNDKDEEDGTKRHHDFMFVPILIWALGLGGLCTYVLLQRDSAPDENVTPTEEVVNLKEEKVIRTVNFLNSSTDSLELVVSDARGEVDRFYVGPKSWKSLDVEPHKYKFLANDLNGTTVMTWENTIGDPTKSETDYDAGWIQMDGGEHKLVMIDVTEMIPADYKSSDLKNSDWTKNVVKVFDGKSLMEPAIPEKASVYAMLLEPGDLLPSKEKASHEVYAIITVPADEVLSNEYLQKRLIELYFE